MRKTIAAALCALLLAAAHAQGGANQQALVITDMDSIQDENGYPAIVGLATNDSGAPIRDAFIRFNLHDAQGNLVGNTIAKASNIAPGQVWRFKAPMVDRDATRYEVVEIKAYK